jgi:hypothetical protein
MSPGAVLPPVESLTHLTRPAVRHDDASCSSVAESSSVSAHALAELRRLLAPLCAASKQRLLIAVCWTLTDWIETFRRECITYLNRGQRGPQSWHAPSDSRTEDGRLIGQIPCWINREHWLSVVAAILATERGRAARRSVRRVAEQTVLRVAEAHAVFADAATGRHCRASVESIAERAGVGTESVRNARQVLRSFDLLIDVSYGRHLSGIEIAAARAHHGGTQRAIASDISLSLPRGAAALVPVPRSSVPRSSAPKCTPLSSFSSVKHLELAQDAGNSKVVRRTRTRERVTPRVRPRPLALQRLAAQVTSRCIGLDDVTDALGSSKDYVPPSCRKSDLSRGNRHLGNICDALAEAGIDPTRWSATQIVRRLNLQAHERGWTWPTTISNPGAYLRWRLNQLDWEDPPAPARPCRSQVAPASAIPTTPAGEQVNPPASDARRKAHYAAMAEACGWRRTVPRQEVSAVHH